jgi:hypothetical protein
MIAAVRGRRRRKVEAEIRAECERGLDTLWTDARWYEELSRDEIEAIVMEYGFGPLTPANRPRYPASLGPQAEVDRAEGLHGDGY